MASKNQNGGHICTPMTAEQINRVLLAFHHRTVEMRNKGIVSNDLLLGVSMTLMAVGIDLYEVL